MPHELVVYHPIRLSYQSFMLIEAKGTARCNNVFCVVFFLFVLLCLIEAYETECNGETVIYMKMEFPFLLSNRDVSFSNAYYYSAF